jgi:hypothetical protein
VDDWVANTEGNSAIMGNGGGYDLRKGKNCVGGGGDKRNTTDSWIGPWLNKETEDWRRTPCS